MPHPEPESGAVVFDALVQAAGQARERSLSVDDALSTIKLVSAAQAELDRYEVALLETLMDGGMTWQVVAEQVYGATARQTAQQRYRRIGGRRSWPAGRPHSL